MKKCPNCMSEAADDAKFCNKCGADLTPKKKLVCPKCGSEVKNKEARFCLECGTSFNESTKPEEEDTTRRICAKCGTVLRNKYVKFCISCGNEFSNENPPLVLDEKNKFYRLCTYCGKAYDLEDDPQKCSQCGKDLDITPRTEPVLTKEEQKIVDDRIAEEKRLEEEKLEKERIEKEEAQRIAKEKEEKRRAKAERKKARIKKILKITGISLAAVIAATLAVLFIWHAFDDRNIEKANDAIARGDYNSAVKYYGYVMPLSYAHSETKIKAEKTALAGKLYEEAKTALDNYEYLKAMQKSKEALAQCPELKVCDDLFTEAQEDMGEYLKKQFDAGKYTEAYNIIKVIYEPYRNEQIKNVFASINNMVNKNVAEGNERLKAGNPSQALASANAALQIAADSAEAIKLKQSIIEYYVNTGTAQFRNYDMDSAQENAKLALSIDPSNQWAKQLESNIGTYNVYTKYMNKAADFYYNNGDYDSADNYIDKVPTDGIGKMVRDSYSGLLSTIEQDKQYMEKPVIIASKDADGRYRSSFNILSDINVYFTLKNRINRPVKVNVSIDIDDNYYRNYTYTISANTSSDYSVSFSGIAARDPYTYNVKITDFEIK